MTGTAPAEPAGPDERVFDAVVLAGGAGRRLGGVDKASVQVGGRRLLDHALAAAAGARRVVVVGPGPWPDLAVPTTCEDPPGGGPVAGIAAGLTALDPAPALHPAPADVGSLAATTVLVLACDVPLAAAAVPALHAALAREPDADGARLVDDAGRAQHLVALYRRDALRTALAALGPADGAAVRTLVAGLRLVDVDAADLAGDADTWADVRRLDADPRTHAWRTGGRIAGEDRRASREGPADPHRRTEDLP